MKVYIVDTSSYRDNTNNNSSLNISISNSTEFYNFNLSEGYNSKVLYNVFQYF